jgi:cytidine deaminase
MTMRDTDRALVQAAGAVARLRCRSARHTVAAAARTAEGRVLTGVNVHHDTDTTCAEVVAVGTAATQGAGELETIVTLGDRGREILAPCDRCRRLLLDYFPAIRVIVGPMDDPRVLPLADLPAGTSA